MNPLFYIGKVVSLAEGEGRPKFKVELLREGRYLHPQAQGGVLVIDEQAIREIKANHDAGARGTEIPTNLGHNDPFCKDSPAWIQQMTVEKGADNKLHLFGVGEITDKKLHEKIDEGRIKYFSPELLFDWIDPQDGKKKKVMKAGAFTNVPHIKGMKAVTLNFEEMIQLDAGFAQEVEEQEDDNDDDPPGVEDAQDPDAKADDLPDQCRSCMMLIDGQCPFKGIDLKKAAAGMGTCPQYRDREALRNNTPQTGDEDGGANMSEKTVTLEEFNALQERVAAMTVANEAKDSQLAKIPILMEENKKLREAHIELEDQAFVKKYFDTGKITAAQAVAVSKLLKASRGSEGILLSDEKTPASVQALLGEILEGVTPQVNLSTESAKAETPTADYEVRLDERATQIAKEEAKTSGRDWTTHYGDALVKADKELGGAK